MTDMLEGKGVRVGLRVESLPENKLRLTGEAFAADPDPDPAPPSRGLDTPEKFLAWAKTQSAAGRLDAWITANSGAPMPFDPDDLDDELLNK
jgi:hypothetical protein